jgi:hypothetical protein
LNGCLEKGTCSSVELINSVRLNLIVCSFPFRICSSYCLPDAFYRSAPGFASSNQNDTRKPLQDFKVAVHEEGAPPPPVVGASCSPLIPQTTHRSIRTLNAVNPHKFQRPLHPIRVVIHERKKTGEHIRPMAWYTSFFL